jgi:hypothetical protein
MFEGPKSVDLFRFLFALEILDFARGVVKRASKWRGSNRR